MLPQLSLSTDYISACVMGGIPFILIYIVTSVTKEGIVHICHISCLLFVQHLWITFPYSLYIFIKLFTILKLICE